MGIDAYRSDENGRELDEVLDGNELLGWLLENAPLESSICLRFIDPYGDTVFNMHQAKQLLSELNNLKAWIEQTDSAKRPAAVKYVDRLRQLAERCGLHEYLKFVGD